MCGSAKKVFKKVASLVRKVWAVIRKYLAYIVFVVALFFPVVWPMIAAYLPAGIVAGITSITAGTIMTSSTLAAFAWRGVVGLALAYILSSEGADDIVGAVKKTTDKVIGAVGEMTSSAVGSTISTLLKSPWVLAAAGGTLFFLLARGKKENKVVIEQQAWDNKESPVY